MQPDEPLPDLTDSLELVRRAQDGQPEALDDLLRRYQDRVRRVVRVRLGSELRGDLDSMDLVQDTMAMAHRDLSKLRAETHAGLMRWFASLAENRIRDASKRLRALKRDRSHRPIGEPGEPDPQADDTLPEDRAARREAREIVDECLAELPEDQREVILQRDYLAADWDEIGQVLGRSVPAAQQLHRRAWVSLRRMVRPRLEE